MGTFLPDLFIVACIGTWGCALACLLKSPPGSEPIIGVCFSVVLLELMGAGNLLFLGAWFLLLAPFVFFGYCVGKYKKQVWHSEFISHWRSKGMISFLCGAIFLSALFSLKEPYFIHWDEFSHWGIYFKSVFTYHKFTIWVPNQTVVHPSYPQGGVALYSLFCLLNNAYRERDALYSLNLLILASASSIWIPLNLKERKLTHNRIANITTSAAEAFSTPAIFLVFNFEVSLPYRTVYMDIPMGCLFMAGIMLLLTKDDLRHKVMPIGLLCGTLTCIKDMGTLFALCIFGILLLLLVLDNELSILVKIRCFCLSALLSFIEMTIWKLATNFTGNAADQFSNMNLLEKLLDACNPDSTFYQILRAYLSEIYNGTFLLGKSVCFWLAVCFAASAVLSFYARKRKNYSVSIVCCIMPIYSLLYLAVLFLVYIGGMSLDEALSVASFERYIGPFFIAWLGAIVISFQICASDIPSPYFAKNIGRLIITAMLLLNCFYFLVVKGCTESFNLQTYTWRREEQEKISKLENNLPKDNIDLLLISGGDINAYDLYRLRYELWPEYRLPLPGQVLTQETTNLMRVIEEAQSNNSAEYLILYGINEDFYTEYKSVLGDISLENEDNNSIYLYKIETISAEQILTFIGVF